MYLAKIGRGDFDLTSAQTTTLDIISKQCSFDGGTSVLAVRGAMEMIAGGPIVWPDNCDYNAQQTDDRNADAGLMLQANVYPNPVDDFLTIELHEPTDEVTLFNTIGTLLYARSALPSGIHTIDCQGLPKGMYLLVLKKQGKLAVTQKIIKY